MHTDVRTKKFLRNQAPAPGLKTLAFNIDVQLRIYSDVVYLVHLPKINHGFYVIDKH